MGVNVIVAVGNVVPGKGYPIGINGSLPWKNKADMKWFRETTMGHPVIMGRNTWESLPRPLEGRINIVVTSGSVYPSQQDDVYEVKSVEDAIGLAKSLSKEDPFIIGGASVYRYAIENGLADTVYMDMLAENVPDADAFFPDIIGGTDWEASGETVEIERSKAYAVTLVRLRGRSNHADDQYLKLVDEIIRDGERKDTRAGKTRSVFSRQMRFNLKEGLPMLTTKKMFSRGVIHELLWFLKGDTNIKYLVDNNVHIWDDDAYRYYLELRGRETLELPEERPTTKEEFIDFVKRGCHTVLGGKLYTFGDLNHVYGYQWTKWGGRNQVEEVIRTLRTDPDDRRMIISAWNVEDIPSMALPPCHFCCQFYTKRMTHAERVAWTKENLKLNPMAYFADFSDDDMDSHDVPTRKLSCVWHQRSVDSLLGLPFNMLSYALLTHMVAQCANMDVDELVFDGGDVHVYENQIETYESTQKLRNPHMHALPTLELNPEITEIGEFSYDDIRIKGYTSYPSVSYPLSVGL